MFWTEGQPITQCQKHVVSFLFCSNVATRDLIITCRDTIPKNLYRTLKIWVFEISYHYIPVLHILFYQVLFQSTEFISFSPHVPQRTLEDIILQDHVLQRTLGDMHPPPHVL